MSDRHPDLQIRHRLAVLRHAEEVTGNVAATCRYYGISRPTFYTWAKRLALEGPDGLKERSRAPLTHPQATSVEVVGKIIHLRQNYHFGPAKSSMCLKRPLYLCQRFGRLRVTQADHRAIEATGRQRCAYVSRVRRGSARQWTSTARHRLLGTSDK